MNIIIENAMTNLPFYKNSIPLNYLRMILEQPSLYTVLGAKSEDETIGMVIAKKNRQASVLSIIYLTVSERKQNTGLEEMFIYQIEDTAKNEKLRTMNFEYVGNSEDYFKYIDGILRKNNWSSLIPQNTIYTAKRYKVENERWFKKFVHSKQNHTFFQWSLLNEEERDELQNGEGIWYPKKLSPFINEEKIDKNASIGMKVDGKVVGWFIIQEVDKNMVLFKTLFLQEEVRSLNKSMQFIIAGLMQAIHREDWQYAMFSIDDENKQMLNFVEKTLKPAILNKKTVYRSIKEIN